jgi:hypothetical protein
VPLSLFAFNLGVEIGQLLFIGAVLAVAYLLRRLYPALMAMVSARGGWGRRIAAYGLGGVAAVWFVSRVALF